METKSSCTGGRRRRHTKKHSHRRRRHTRRGGAAFADFRTVENYPGGHVDVRGATSVAEKTANTEASNYGGAPSTANGYSGGRRRSRRGRKSRRSRHRMRGGGGTGAGSDTGSRIQASFVGPVSGVNWGVAERTGVYTGSQGV